ncbi:MAG: hypothetical protein ACE361_14045 [Aureliella sp.]
MNESTPNPWIHIGECPECVDGLVRVRTCCKPGSGKELQLYATCDECEATWLAPDTATENIHPDPENAACPICDEPLFGDCSRWSLPADIQNSDWSEHCIVQLTSNEVDDLPTKSDSSLLGESDSADLQVPGDRDEAPGC